MKSCDRSHTKILRRSAVDAVSTFGDIIASTLFEVLANSWLLTAYNGVAPTAEGAVGATLSLMVVLGSASFNSRQGERGGWLAVLMYAGVAQCQPPPVRGRTRARS